MFINPNLKKKTFRIKKLKIKNQPNQYYTTKELNTTYVLVTTH